jgi:pilus assembly protein CpaE
MTRKIRVILVDPDETTRTKLQVILSSIASISLAESCSSYQNAALAAEEHLPDLVLVMLDGDPAAAIELLHRLHERSPAPAILPLSQIRDPDTILRVMRAGAREFLTWPFEVSELMSAFERLVHTAEDGLSKRIASRVITVTSASGGCGATTIAIHLATALAGQSDKSVALVDFDMIGGTLDACLDIVPERTILEVAQAADRLDFTLLKRSLVKHESGLFILPRPLSLEDVSRIDAESLRQAVGLLKAAFPTVVIDAGNSLQPWDLVALESADVIIMTVLLDVPSLRNTSRLLQLFRQQEGMIDRVKIVANRVGSNRVEISRKKSEEILGLPISHEIPNSSKEIQIAHNCGVTLEKHSPNSKIFRIFRDLAKQLDGDPQESLDGPAPAPKRRGFGRIAAMFV